MALIEKRISAEVDYDGASGEWRVLTVMSTDHSLSFADYKYFKSRNRASRYAHNLKNKYSSVSIRE